MADPQWNVSQVAQPNAIGQASPSVGQSYQGPTFQGLPSGYNLYPIQSYTDPVTGVTSAGGYLYGTGNDPANYKYSANLYPYMVASKSNPGGFGGGASQTVGPTSYNGKTANDPMGYWSAQAPSTPQGTQTMTPQNPGLTFGNQFLPANFTPGSPGSQVPSGNPFTQIEGTGNTLNQTTPGLGVFKPWSPNQAALSNLNQGQ